VLLLDLNSFDRDAAIEKIRSFLRTYQSNLSFAHGYDHAERVSKLALHIAGNEGGDTLIIEIAALLHDIGLVPLAALKRELTRDDKGEEHITFLSYLTGISGHGEVSSLIAGNLLKEMNLPDEKLEHVCGIIQEHYSGTSQIAKKTLESRILNDADVLDRCGATWIARAFQRTSAFDRRLGIGTVVRKHLEPSSYSTRHTETAQKMMEKRVAFQNKFLKQLVDELELKS